MRKKKSIQIGNKIKLSNSARMTLIVIAILLFAISSGKLMLAINSKEQVVEQKTIYNYKNNYNEKATINLKENPYISENEIAEDQAYLSDLISTIDMKMQYKYTGSEQEKIIYNYKIETILKAAYVKENKSYDILNKVETIKEVGEKTENSKDISITEFITIDYAKYHSLIKQFKQDMGISTDTFLYIRLTVNTKTTVGSEEVENQYISDYNITVGDKIAIISETENTETSESILAEKTSNNAIEVKPGIAIPCVIGMFIGIILFIFVLTRTEELRSIKNEFGNKRKFIWNKKMNTNLN